MAQFDKNLGFFLAQECFIKKKLSIANVAKKCYILCMSYKYRELLNFFEKKINPIQPKGFILSGVVGCGKTTLVKELIRQLEANRMTCFSFTGDDVRFRKEIQEDSNYFLTHINSEKNLKKIFLFVDEVQKCDEIFDALKIAFDSGRVSFIVSGSNPAYLSTTAKKRLQRRAEFIYMLPFSLSEVFIQKQLITPKIVEVFDQIIKNIKNFEAPLGLQTLNLTPRTEAQSENHTENSMQNLITNYFQYGGLPLAYLSQNTEDKLREIKLTVERGFELISVENNLLHDKVRIELAELHSKEFTYKNIMQKTRVRKRDQINLIINELINHGYLVRKKPMLLTENKDSYLSVYSYIDPGIVTYLSGETALSEAQLGFQIEGYVHAKLDYKIKNSNLKMEMGYYKFHQLEASQKIKYLGREIDFIIKSGSDLLPIEVKKQHLITQIKTDNLLEFMKLKKLKLGLIIYGGVPHFDEKNKILYWPYWAI